MAETEQNQKIRDAYELQLTNSIDAIYASKAYTSIKDVYDSGRIEFEQFERWLSDFNEKAFFTAEKFASTIAMMDPFKDEKSEIEKDMLALEKFKLQCEKDIVCIEKEILVEQRPINKAILEHDRDTKKENLDILKEQRPINKDILERTRDKLAKDIEVLDAQKANLALDNAIKSERRVNEMILIAKDIALKDASINTEGKRAALIDRQRIGFSDNLIIQRVQTINESIGMIQSGGNEAPQALWNEQAAATGQIASISGR